MNGRKLYREYLKSLECDCKEFIELKNDPHYGIQEITYKDSTRNKKTKSVDPVKMINWIILSFTNGVWDSYKYKE